MLNPFPSLITIIIHTQVYERLKESWVKNGDCAYLFCDRIITDNCELRIFDFGLKYKVKFNYMFTMCLLWLKNIRCVGFPSTNKKFQLENPVHTIVMQIVILKKYGNINWYWLFNSQLLSCEAKSTIRTP